MVSVWVPFVNPDFMSFLKPGYDRSNFHFSVIVQTVEIFLLDKIFSGFDT